MRTLATERLVGIFADRTIGLSKFQRESPNVPNPEAIVVEAQFVDPNFLAVRKELTGSLRKGNGWTDLYLSRAADLDRLSPSERGHMAQVSITVNGEQRSADVDPRMLLVHFLREQLNLTGTHVGCDTSQCGACTVLVDGRSAKSCTIFAVQADGSEVTTIEGLADGDQLHPLQNGFWEEHGLQCGYCTPGMIMSAVNLLKDNPSPTEREIREGLDGNLCRCTGYQHIVNAVQHAADKG